LEARRGRMVLEWLIGEWNAETAEGRRCAAKRPAPAVPARRRAIARKAAKARWGKPRVVELSPTTMKPLEPRAK
jgi:hypothetical protein